MNPSARVRASVWEFTWLTSHIYPCARCRWASVLVIEQNTEKRRAWISSSRLEHFLNPKVEVAPPEKPRFRDQNPALYRCQQFISQFGGRGKSQFVLKRLKLFAVGRNLESVTVRKLDTTLVVDSVVGGGLSLLETNCWWMFCLIQMRSSTANLGCHQRSQDLFRALGIFSVF